MLEKLVAAHEAGQLIFFGTHAALADAEAFAAFLAPLRRTRWFVYAKRPFAGPKAVLAYLSRYTHRVAISNRRLIAADGGTVTFKVKDYRREGAGRNQTMTLDAHEFIRRFLIHVLPKGFHRIRHYGLLASGVKVGNLALARKLLGGAPPLPEPDAEEATPAADPGVQDRPLPVLWRGHADHRGFRGRADATSSSDRDACRDQDRYVMSTLPEPQDRDASRLAPRRRRRPAPAAGPSGSRSRLHGDHGRPIMPEIVAVAGYRSKRPILLSTCWSSPSSPSLPQSP